MPNATAEQALITPEALRPWIAGVRSPHLTGPAGQAFVQLPDALPRVVLRVTADGHRDVLVLGPRVRATYHESKALVSCVELRLAPGTARPLLGVPAAELLGAALPLEVLPGGAARRLAAGLRWLGPEEVVPYLAEALPGLLPASADPSYTALLRAGAEALSVRADRTPAQVRDVARELALSERQLRNVFADGVGVSPKQYARINRVRTVLTRGTGTPWAEVAATTGYYDQSHMTSDFRAVMGVPPRSFFSGRLPLPTPCRATRRP
ncbi:AraC family transcriptional regulator [Streptomyces actinomycinicus]|uniref:AraC family transcriptional regulator n=1 Tax=Streptomyces actinomycinicus TaxID=1695166 RepID=A0A937JMZ0_9ACTN|nr:helix-turn-helix domain-containing protein [Streptomyces actinomycinicus]MBL1084025.1 AraC family transcriptional regulator [Streptomyces actinomycinicus]